jgi:hypothetical protein
MSKPYQAADLSRQLFEDRNWRIHEISDLKSATRRADKNLQRALLRGIVTLCYAHWEGHVKMAASKFMEHISLRKPYFRDLQRQFTLNHFQGRLVALEGSKGSFTDRCEIIESILDSANKQFKRVPADLINTQSNLSFRIFSAICVVCGVDPELFEDRRDFIDLMLLKRRNAIAHGEDTFVSIDDLDRLTNETIDLMREFGDALDNCASLEHFRCGATRP